MALSSAELWHDVLQRLAEVQEGQILIAQALADLGLVVGDLSTRIGTPLELPPQLAARNGHHQDELAVADAAPLALPHADTPSAEADDVVTESATIEPGRPEKAARRHRFRLRRRHSTPEPDDTVLEAEDVDDFFGAEDGRPDDAIPAPLWATLPPPPLVTPPPPFVGPLPPPPVATTPTFAPSSVTERSGREVEPALSHEEPGSVAAPAASLPDIAVALAEPRDEQVVASELDPGLELEPAHEPDVPIIPHALVYTPATAETALGDATPLSLDNALLPLHPAPVAREPEPVVFEPQPAPVAAASEPEPEPAPALETVQPQPTPVPIESALEEATGSPEAVLAGVGAAVQSSASLATEILANAATPGVPREPAPLVISEDVTLISRNRKKRLTFRVR